GSPPITFGLSALDGDEGRGGTPSAPRELPRGGALRPRLRHIDPPPHSPGALPFGAVRRSLPPLRRPDRSLSLAAAADRRKLGRSATRRPDRCARDPRPDRQRGGVGSAERGACLRSASPAVRSSSN